MTATQLPVRGHPAPARRPSAVPLGRLLWLELRHSPMPWTFPLLAALFAFDPYRTAMGYPAAWTIRASVLPNKMLPDFVVFVVGVAAWMGSRDGRRRTLDLVETTPRPRWAAQLATWAATTIWAMAGFLAGVGVLYGVTASQATWGGPPWWPVIVCCAELAVLAAGGFVAGALFPGRFTAPLAAVAAFLLCLEGFRNAVGRSSALAVLSPATYVPVNDAGVFYPYPPDVAIDQLIFLAGLTAAVLGVLGLARASGTGPGLRRAAAVITAAGTAALVTAAALAATARQVIPGTSQVASVNAPMGMQGAWIIPALHDAASDRPVPYTPACQSVATVPVCIHPAFQGFLPDATAALRPVLRQIAGLPGAPARAGQVATGSLTRRGPGGSVAIGIGTPDGVLTGSPPAFEYTADMFPARAFGLTHIVFVQSMQGELVAAFLPAGGSLSAGPGAPHHGPHHGGRPGGAAGGGPAGIPQSPAVLARMAVQSALLLVAGMPQKVQPQALGQEFVEPAAQQAQVTAAARRLAAMPAAARHAWLAAHLAALRGGQLTVGQLP
jgi:hypothetical protein